MVPEIKESPKEEVIHVLSFQREKNNRHVAVGGREMAVPFKGEAVGAVGK